MSNIDMMVKAIETYNLISDLENDMAMGMDTPEGLDEDLMQKTKDTCLSVIFAKENTNEK